MGIMDRINEIESRMHEIQSLVNSQQAEESTPPAPTGAASFQSVMGSVAGAQTPGETPPVAGALPGMPTSIAGLSSMLPGMNAQGTAPVPSSTPANPSQFDPFIKEACGKWNMDESLVKAVIQQESNFNPEAKSSCGAQGLMQLMPETARSLGVSNAYDANQNIQGGTRYLKGLLDRFNGNVRLALAAYNAGAGSVQKYGGVPPFAETQNYVSKIMANYERMKSSKG